MSYHAILEIDFAQLNALPETGADAFAERFAGPNDLYVVILILSRIDGFHSSTARLDRARSLGVRCGSGRLGFLRPTCGTALPPDGGRRQGERSVPCCLLGDGGYSATVRDASSYLRSGGGLPSCPLGGCR
jgi:hypothetical protein